MEGKCKVSICILLEVFRRLSIEDQKINENRGMPLKSNKSVEEGQFRVDVNISLVKDNTNDRGVRTEIKNLNSLRMVRTAVNNEIDRQYEILRAGGTVLNETCTLDRNGLVVYIL